MSQQHLVDRRDVAQKLWRGGMCQTSWICRVFGVDRSTFWRWMKVDFSADAPARKRGGRPCKVTPERARWLAELAVSRVTCNQREMAREFEREFGVAISQQTVSRILGEQGIVRKKLKFVSPEAMAKPERQVTFHERIAGVEPENLAALDESSFHINEGPTHGYARRGQEAVVERSGDRGTKLTLALCVSMVPRPSNYGGCVVSYELYEGNMNGDRFVRFLGTIGAGRRAQQHGDGDRQSGERTSEELVVIPDNAGYHGSPVRKTKDADGQTVYRDSSATKSHRAVHDAAKANGLRMTYMRPRSPQFNPTEPTFSVIKRRVRKDCLTTMEELIASIRSAIDYVATMDLSKMFRHCLKASKTENLPFVLLFNPYTYRTGITRWRPSSR
ncbi:hypothetical protein DFJ74DRAFT_767572 [Hyaloraphidium curvatum]|nr:hypothetical protein DFJ74DRAFT_767572 [Hyaloraphidium curvatum]